MLLVDPVEADAYRGSDDKTDDAHSFRPHDLVQCDCHDNCEVRERKEEIPRERCRKSVEDRSNARMRDGHKADRDEQILHNIPLYAKSPCTDGTLRVALHPCPGNERNQKYVLGSQEDRQSGEPQTRILIIVKIPAVIRDSPARGRKNSSHEHPVINIRIIGIKKAVEQSFLSLHA